MQRGLTVAEMEALYAERDALRIQQEAALRQIAMLRAVLEAVEWEQWTDGGEYCPWCTVNKKLGHTQNCPRQVALGLMG